MGMRSREAYPQIRSGHLHRETRVRAVTDELWVLDIIEADRIARTEFAPDEASIRELDGSVRVRPWVR